MDDLTIAAIRRRLRSKPTDVGKATYSRFRTGDPAEIASDERRLGFAFPPLMKRIYIEIGNGGFGPGYGLIGFTNGAPDDTGRTAPEIYNQLRSSEWSASGWKWPHGLLPVCHWGCAILSCVDCTDPNFRMRIFDPNVHEKDDWADSLFEGSDGFGIWMRDWASGADLWEAMYGTDGHVARILSARRSIG
jgi:SMI1/KNR4 family protein SUKH-1